MDLSKKYQKITDAKYPDVGNFINYYIQSNKKSKAQLARDLDVIPSTLNDYFKNSSLQFGIIWKISKALDYNFIAHLAEYLYIPFETKAEKELKQQLAEKEKRIEQLEFMVEVYKGK